MNTTEFIQAIEDHKVLINDKDEMIVKDDNGTIWFFGFGITGHADIVQPSDKFRDSVVFSRWITIMESKIPFPTMAATTDKWRVRE